MPDLWRNRTRGAIRWINPALPEMRKTGRYPRPHPRPPLHLVPHLDTAVCTASSRFQTPPTKQSMPAKWSKYTNAPDLRQADRQCRKYRPFCSKRCADIDLVPGLPKDMLLKAKRRLTRKKGNNIPFFIALSILRYGSPIAPAASRSGLNLYPQQLNQPPA